MSQLVITISGFWGYNFIYYKNIFPDVQRFLFKFRTCVTKPFFFIDIGAVDIFAAVSTMFNPFGWNSTYLQIQVHAFKLVKFLISPVVI